MSRISSTFGRARSPNSSQSFAPKKSANFSFSNNISGKNFLSTSSPTNHTTGKEERSVIESDYIKNLQQQIYFLELETNYLREQLKKSSELKPAMNAEAEKMLQKLRSLQAENDMLQIELKRRESTVEIIQSEKCNLLERTKELEDKHIRDRRLLTEDIVQLKKEKEMMALDGHRKDAEVENSNEELYRLKDQLKNAEHQIDLLKTQLDQRLDQHKLTQLELQQKRAEVVDKDTKYRELEEKYLSSSASMHDTATNSLREEIRHLRQKQKEVEMSAEHDRYLRNKISEDSTRLIKENALLNQQVIELQRQVEHERDIRENKDTRATNKVAEICRLEERERTLLFELKKATDLFNSEQERSKHLAEQLSNMREAHNSAEMSLHSTQNRLSEMQVLRDENEQLRTDKMILVDHVADLQKKLSRKEHEFNNTQTKLNLAERQLTDFETEKQLDSSLKSQQFEEIQRLADNMKSLSHSLQATSSRTSPRLRKSLLFDNCT